MLIRCGAAISSAERLISADGIKAIVGADCSGVTIATLQNVAMAKGMVMISPSATSPALSDMDDNGLFFRTAPSDAREGQVVAEMLKEQGYSTVALTTNNDYGKGLADAIQTNFEAMGGSITIVTAMKKARVTTALKLAPLLRLAAIFWLLPVTLTRAAR